jgi:hypothetical protein
MNRARQAKQSLFLFPFQVFFLTGLWPMGSSCLAQNNPTDQPQQKRVYTNEDLKSLPKKQTPAPTETAPAQKPSTVRQSEDKDRPSVDNDKDLNGHDKVYWQKRSHALNDKLAQLDAEADSLEKRQKEQQRVQGLKVSSDGHFRVPGESKKIADRLQKIKQQRALVLQQIEEMEDEARKAGAPPGWLR